MDSNTHQQTRRPRQIRTSQQLHRQPTTLKQLQTETRTKLCKVSRLPKRRIQKTLLPQGLETDTNTHTRKTRTDNSPLRMVNVTKTPTQPRNRLTTRRTDEPQSQRHRHKPTPSLSNHSQERGLTNPKNLQPTSHHTTRTYHKGKTQPK